MSRTKSWRGTRIYTPAILHRGAMRLIGLVSQVQLDAGLRERHMGIFQGLTLAEMRERFPTNALNLNGDGACSLGSATLWTPGGASGGSRSGWRATASTSSSRATTSAAGARRSTRQGARNGNDDGGGQGGRPARWASAQPAPRTRRS